MLTVSKALTDRYKAGDLIKGSRRSSAARAAGGPTWRRPAAREVGKLDEAMNRLYGLVEAS